MSSIILIHPEETFTVSAVQAMTKCSLFEKHVMLTSVPYRVESSVTLSTFREFVSELKGETVNITCTNLRGLDLLCEEFGFTEFASKLSQFSERLKYSQRRPFGNSFSGMRNAQLNESFEFIVNGRVIESDFSESAAFFRSVREQLSVDGCARKFFVNANGIEAADIRSLQLFLSGETISNGRSQRFLSGLLGNETLERLFLNFSKTDIQMNLFDFVIENRIELKSVDVSSLSFEALDSLLLSDSISVESEDSLLQFVLKLGSEYRDLLRHIKVEFLSEYGFSLLVFCQNQFGKGLSN
jgi:hypothetical protein